MNLQSKDTKPSFLRHLAYKYASRFNSISIPIIGTPLRTHSHLPDSPILTDTKMANTSIEERLHARDKIAKAPPAYLPTAGSALAVDREAYKAIQAADRVLVEEFTLPIRSGKAWEAPAGSIVRISTPDGPQVGTSYYSHSHH